MSKHQNNGKCPKCAEIMNKFPGMNAKLKSWFVLFQAAHPEAHTSCVGRGRDEQREKVRAGRSRARWGRSAHNYNCAVDLFVMLPQKDIYDRKWFKEVVAPSIPYYLNWYGAPGSSFPELPHVELRNWRELKATGEAKLVEDHSIFGLADFEVEDLDADPVIDGDPSQAIG